MEGIPEETIPNEDIGKNEIPALDETKTSTPIGRVENQYENGRIMDMATWKNRHHGSSHVIVGSNATAVTYVGWLWLRRL